MLLRDDGTGAYRIHVADYYHPVGLLLKQHLLEVDHGGADLVRMGSPADVQVVIGRKGCQLVEKVRRQRRVMSVDRCALTHAALAGPNGLRCA